ncbi:MAG: nucleotidyltransferase family protein [Pseudomonadota bacterium]
MTKRPKVAGILLAAGRSTRFGSEDKLLAPFRGAPLVTHAAKALARASSERPIAVCASRDVTRLLPEFKCIEVDGSSRLMSDSLAAGIAAARLSSAQSALIVLGDMPLITTELLNEVLDLATDQMGAAATTGLHPTPPACIPLHLFGTSSEAPSDSGARAILANLPPSQLVEPDPCLLRDIDTQDDLADLDF